MTTITMSVRRGTVETRRARPTACPHAGHLRSTVMWGARRFNPSTTRVLKAAVNIKHVGAYLRLYRSLTVVS
jgi:hypothetical protein